MCICLPLEHAFDIRQGGGNGDHLRKLCLVRVLQRVSIVDERTHRENRVTHIIYRDKNSASDIARVHTEHSCAHINAHVIHTCSTSARVHSKGCTSTGKAVRQEHHAVLLEETLRKYTDNATGLFLIVGQSQLHRQCSAHAA